MDTTSGIDWEDALENGAYIPGAADYPPRWNNAAAAFRSASGWADIDLPYGDAPREALDLFHPNEPPKGLVVFVHGGYWKAFDKSTWSGFAAGAIARGWAVAMPSYTLAPDATIPQITQQIGAAITVASTKIDGPIRLVGHSAGGHLVTRMMCQNTPLPLNVAARIGHVVSISGVHDLHPLRQHSMNAILNLTAEDAAAESPALLTPRAGTSLTCWVGAAERPEFLRQSALLTESWGRQGAQTELVAETAKHHFNVIDGLDDPTSALIRVLLDGPTAF
jgi:arylformamidase